MLHIIDESTVVTFDGKTYPKYGWAVILAGGPGSGKGFSKGSICIDAKSFDVDELKKQYQKASARPNTSIYKNAPKHDWDMKNSDDVSTLHNIVATGNGKGLNYGYDKRSEYNFFNSNSNSADKLPNVIFDITGDKPQKIINKALTAKSLGYKLSFVWIVTNREEAMIRNAGRDRVVGDEIFHSKHNTINSIMLDFITKEAGKYFDEAWVLFASNNHAGGTKAEFDWLKAHRTIKFDKVGDKFIVKDADAKRILDTLGEDEPNPRNPEKYMKKDDVVNAISKYDKYSQVRSYDTKFKHEKLILRKPKR